MRMQMPTQKVRLRFNHKIIRLGQPGDASHAISFINAKFTVQWLRMPNFTTKVLVQLTAY
jgi:hypothetical protein